MNRRQFLTTSSAALGALAIAGCSESESGNGSGNGNGNGADTRETSTVTPTPTPNPASQLDAEGFLSGDEDTGEWLVEIDAANPTDQPISAEFSADLTIDDGRGELMAESSEQTVPADDSTRIQLPLADPSSLDFEQLAGVVFHGGQLRILVDGTVQADACPDTSLSNPNDQGCEYPYGLSETHVEVEYGGDWKGAAGSGGNTRTVSRSSVPYGAPQGYDTSYVQVSSDANVVSANAQKQDDSGETLTIRIVHRDEVVAEQSTSASYGVAQVSTTL